MRTINKRLFSSLFFTAFILTAAMLSSAPVVEETPKPKAMVIEVDGIINPVSEEFIVKSLRKAEEQSAEILVIELDTPGGLMTSMREIIKAMLQSPVPVAVFVSPGGARAGSAGTFITMAAHIAAMAPQTNIGAAHPVDSSGNLSGDLRDKATNDAVAFIKSLAEERGRNIEWAASSVANSVSATAEEALKKGVIDLIVEDTPALLKKIDGKEVKVFGGRKKLATAGAEIIREEMGTRLRILDIISDPNIAYILMLLGVYGLFYELVSPGAIFPGVMGAICLILGLYALSTLPVNYAGMALIAVAIIMFILEIKVTSYGALTIGGVIAMIAGSLMLFESPAPFMRLSLLTILPAVIVTAGFFTFAMTMVIRAHRRRPVTGIESLIGREAVAGTEITPEGGSVKLSGEIWSARSDSVIEKGKTVIIEELRGLRMKVRERK